MARRARRFRAKNKGARKQDDSGSPHVARHSPLGSPTVPPVQGGVGFAAALGHAYVGLRILRIQARALDGDAGLLPRWRQPCQCWHPTGSWEDGRGQIGEAANVEVNVPCAVAHTLLPRREKVEEKSGWRSFTEPNIQRLRPLKPLLPPPWAKRVKPPAG